MYRPDPRLWKLDEIAYANAVSLGDQQRWIARNGWQRVFTSTARRNGTQSAVAYKPFAERQLVLEPPDFFKAEEPDADRMTYGELKSYIGLLQSSGSMNVVPYLVQLQRKVAFIGAGLVIALIYWITLSVMGALGAGGWISPVLAAWAPNILFGAAAIYLLLTVRT
jgi:lipopolysaccharide export LptBFGC system permease protein LptF